MMMSSIFTTMYQQVTPKFSGLIITTRTLFDAMMGVYDYEFMDEYFLSYSLLLIFHVFLSNVLLLNFYIAFLSILFEEGTETTGEFAYLTNKY